MISERIPSDEVDDDVGNIWAQFGTLSSNFVFLLRYN